MSEEDLDEFHKQIEQSGLLEFTKKQQGNLIRMILDIISEEYQVKIYDNYDDDNDYDGKTINLEKIE